MNRWAGLIVDPERRSQKSGVLTLARVARRLRPRHHRQRWRPLHAKAANEAAPGAHNRRGILECRAGQHAPEPEEHLDVAPDGRAPKRVTRNALTVPECGHD